MPGPAASARSGMRLRPSRTDDSPALQRVEAATHEQFRDVGLASVADDDPDPLEVLVGYAMAGRSWVAVGDDDRPVGYLLVDRVDGATHITQVTVVPEWQGRGIGRMLVDRAVDWARAAGSTGVTLTTFSEVPWNRPLYEHLGFTVLDEESIGPELRAIIDDEAAKGFGPDGRVAMGLPLGGGRWSPLAR